MFGTDGQKIAKRLSSQISKQMSKIVCLLKELNHITVSLTGQDDSLPLSVILDPSSQFWLPAESDHSSSGVSTHIKQTVIHNYLQFQRSAEELQILRQDMHNTLQYHQQRVSCLQVKIKQLNHADEQTPFTKGAICLLSKLLDKVTIQLLCTVGAFAEFIDVSCSDKPSQNCA